MSPSINTNLLAGNVARNTAEHYSRLSASVRRLSTGLRVGTAADDAAGLAIRELMRTDIAGLQQGARNANDAISMIQTADGALAVIDEKLIRMKELAEQAATGTYDSTQRLMIDSEFQAMAQEIDRIANSTDFNGVKLLDGSLNGEHDGSGLTSAGKMKVHFGTGNDSAEDYYYVNIANSTLYGLGLATGSGRGGVISSEERIPGDYGYYHPTADSVSNVKMLWAWLDNGAPMKWFESGISVGVIPQGTTNLRIHINDNEVNDSMQLFSLSGEHILGTRLGTSPWLGFGNDSINSDILAGEGDKIINRQYGFYDEGATYSDANLQDGHALPFTPGTAGNVFTYHGMTIGYSGDGNSGIASGENCHEYLTIDEVKEDLIFMNVGAGYFGIQASWDFMPYYAGGRGAGSDVISIPTQQLAQEALVTLDRAITIKDNIRSHLGALQNRLENTVTNLSIQAENLQSAESRISDVDVATEMTNMVRNQILSQSSISMLAQANTLPQMLTQLIGG